MVELIVGQYYGLNNEYEFLGMIEDKIYTGQQLAKFRHRYCNHARNYPIDCVNVNSPLHTYYGKPLTMLDETWLCQCPVMLRDLAEKERLNKQLILMFKQQILDWLSKGMRDEYRNVNQT